MANNKTLPTNTSVAHFIENIPDKSQRVDAGTLVNIMQSATGFPPVLWGPAIIGFGTFHYVYASGREGDTPIVSFAVRKNALTLYGVMFYEHNENNMKLVALLGPHTHGKGCLYIKKLADINLDILKQMIQNSLQARSKAV